MPVSVTKVHLDTVMTLGIQFSTICVILSKGLRKEICWKQFVISKFLIAKAIGLKTVSINVNLISSLGSIVICSQSCKTF